MIIILPDFKGLCYTVQNMNSQQLLFETSPFIKPASLPVHDSFYTNGYTTFSEITSIEDALQKCQKFIGSLDGSRLPLLSSALSRIQPAKVDRIPVCDEIVQTGFQALHFDMGQPFLAEQAQTMYLISALYRPTSSEPNSEAKTRLVNLEKLLSQKSFGSKGEVEQKFTHYVSQYGDGWHEPEFHNTQRLAIFARVIDAVSGLNKMTEKIDTMIGQCFEYDESQKGNYGLKQETDFFAQAGLDLKKVEEQIEIKPGQLLIFDNLRCVHGRIGKRKKQELYNFIFGVKKAAENEIDNYRDWMINQLI